MFRKGLSVLLSVIMVISVFSSIPFTANAEDAQISDIGATSGTTGDCTWTLDDNNVLTISGS